MAKPVFCVTMGQLHRETLIELVRVELDTVQRACRRRRSKDVGTYEASLVEILAELEAPMMGTYWGATSPAGEKAWVS